MTNRTITVEKICRFTTDRDAPTTKWVARIDGKFTAEALTRRDALKWARQHRDWLDRPACAHETVWTPDGHGAYCKVCGECLA